jgi:hypothetical protein
MRDLLPARFRFRNPINRLSGLLASLILVLAELIQSRFVNFQCAALDAVDLVIPRA